MVALMINLHMVLIAKGEKLQDFPPIHHAKGMDGGWYVFALSFYTFSWLTWQWVNGGTWMPSPPLAYTEPESGTKGNKVRVGSPKTLAELDLTRLFQDLYRLNASPNFCPTCFKQHPKTQKTWTSTEHCTLKTFSKSTSLTKNHLFT